MKPKGQPSLYKILNSFSQAPGLISHRAILLFCPRFYGVAPRRWCGPHSAPQGQGRAGVAHVIPHVLRTDRELWSFPWGSLAGLLFTRLSRLQNNNYRLYPSLCVLLTSSALDYCQETWGVSMLSATSISLYIVRPGQSLKGTYARKAHRVEPRTPSDNADIELVLMVGRGNTARLTPYSTWGRDPVTPLKAKTGTRDIRLSRLIS